MPRDLYSKYVWILETVKRYGAITREDLSERWLRSQVSDGNPLARRTFFNYRQAIEEIFNVNIIFNKATNEYSIEENNLNPHMTDWVLNSLSTMNLLNDSHDIADSIFLEEIPSAKEYLSLTIDALKNRSRMKFTYNSYTRPMPTKGIVLEPYFLKLFRQRWYVTGKVVRDKTVKTYALDRMTDATLLSETYEIPESFDARLYSRDSFGIVFNNSEAVNVILKVTPGQAKYFRALPLHKSQDEKISDGFSIFSYRLKLTDDFIQELMSHGASITVLEPPELRDRMVENLKKTLRNYEED